jgi:hypothetical protein
MNGRPPTKKELNQQERKVMKVAGEKLVLYPRCALEERKYQGFWVMEG